MEENSLGGEEEKFSKKNIGGWSISTHKNKYEINNFIQLILQVFTKSTIFAIKFQHVIKLSISEEINILEKRSYFCCPRYNYGICYCL